MLKIRLKRYGRKNLSVYRIVVIDSKKQRDGKVLEEVGYYDPIKSESRFRIDQIKKRISEGARMSKTVKSLVKNI